MTDEELAVELEKIYARIPAMKDCVGKCEDSCTVVPVTAFEKARIEKVLGREFTSIVRPDKKVRCSALVDGRCSVYDIRPVLCRVFGTSRHPFLKCEHGCSPERWLPGIDVLSILMDMERLFGPSIQPEVPGWHKLTEEEALAGARLLLED